MSLPLGSNPGPSGLGAPNDSAAQNRLRERYRREAIALYDGPADKFGLPMRTATKPGLWSPATLRELAAEVLRRELFLKEWVEAGGMDTFARRGGKFNGTVLRLITEEPYSSFIARVTAWRALNPRPQFPALPTPPRRNEWSVQELVRNHPYFVPSPDKAGNDSQP